MENRTSAIGMLLYGESYLEAARFLYFSERKKTIKLRFCAPIHFLLGHAFELVLKAYFRARGETLDNLKDRGHDLINLWKDSEANGLEVLIEEQTIEHLRLLNNIFGKSPYETRYIVTGLKQYPDCEQLIKFAQSLVSVLRPICHTAFRSDQRE